MVDYVGSSADIVLKCGIGHDDRLLYERAKYAAVRAGVADGGDRRGFVRPDISAHL